MALQIKRTSSSGPPTGLEEGQLAVEMNFHVSGAFEFFKDHVVHTASGIDERRGDNGERSAFFDVARRSEEALGPLQGI